MARKVEIINEVPDYVPKKKKKEEKMENPLEKRTKLPDFSEKYEEDLKRKLFEEDLKRMASKNVKMKKNLNIMKLIERWFIINEMVTEMFLLVKK